MMTPDRWQQIKDTFHAALERAPSERAAFLEEVGTGDDLLRREIESLIQASEETGKFVDAPAYEKLADLAAHGQGLAAGESIARYSIVSQLGKGGMGAVYLAHDGQLERNVAIKLLPSYFANDSDRLRRFAQEARAASALNHPNILTIYEIGETDSTRFIVTEFIDGLTLRQRLAQSPLPLAEALDIAISVAAALEAAHRVKIVHRDIKPENIMLRRDDGLVKVIDFGLAKATEKPTSGAPDHEASVKALLDTAPGVIMGTVAYMSPEQARAHDVDARTDIWSLGVVLYEMVTGRVPFAGETPSHVIVSVMESEPAALARDGELPAELERIVMKALRKDKDERYQTASELVQELKNLKQGLERGWITTKNDGQTTFDAVHAAAGRITAAGTIQRTTRAENLVSQIKRHKRTALVVSPIVVVCLLGLAYWLTRPAPHKTITEVKSMAVLPFKNIGGKEDEDYLGQGLAEVLVTRLSNLKTIVVRPTSAVMKYRDATPDPKKIGNDLDVEAFVMGHVQKVDNNIRVTVQLVRVSDGATLWAETFDDKFTNIFAVQDSIATQVTGSLAINLNSAERQQLTKRDTANTEAFQLYLQGRYFWNKRSLAGNNKAVEFFTQAINKDANFARAYSGLADSYMLLGKNEAPGWNPRELIAKAKEAANKALALDDTLTEAHTSLGYMAYNYDLDWVNSESHFRRAIELNPNYVTAHQWYSQFLNELRRFDESEAEMKKALQLDPSSLIVNTDYGGILYDSRRYDLAVAQYKKTLELEPRFHLAHVGLGRAYAMQKRYDEAIAEYNQALEISGRSFPYLASQFGYAYAMSGRKAEAEKILRAYTALSQRQTVLPYSFISIYIGLNNKKKAMEWMEKAFTWRYPAPFSLGVDPKYDSLRDEPRFQEMLKELKLN